MMEIRRGMHPEEVTDTEYTADSKIGQFLTRVISLKYAWMSKGIFTSSAEQCVEDLKVAHEDLCDDPDGEYSISRFDSMLEYFCDFIETLGTEEDEDEYEGDFTEPTVPTPRAEDSYRYFKGLDPALDESWVGGFYVEWVSDVRSAEPDEYAQLIEIRRRAWKRQLHDYRNLRGKRNMRTVHKEMDLYKATHAYAGTRYLVAAAEQDPEGLEAAFRKFDKRADKFTKNYLAKLDMSEFDEVTWD